MDMDLGRSGGLGGRTSSSLLGSNIDREFSSLSSNVGGRTSSSLLGSNIDREVSSLSSSLSTDPLLKYNSPLATTGSGRAAESSYQAKSYSSSTTQSSGDGGRPHMSSHSDSTHKSTRSGSSGIPHTSYSHNTSSFDTDRPYKNNVSSYSYNI